MFKKVAFVFFQVSSWSVVVNDIIFERDSIGGFLWKTCCSPGNITPPVLFYSINTVSNAVTCIVIARVCLKQTGIVKIWRPLMCFF